MPEQRKKTASLTLRIDAATKALAERAAAADGRSLAAVVETLLADWLRSQGHLPKAGRAIPVEDLNASNDE
jgi:hypothetical protein